MFVDASALLAILANEPDKSWIVEQLDSASNLFTSPIAVFETTANLCRIRAISVDVAKFEVEQLLTRARIAIEPIDRATGDIALSAFARYGKGRGHPAQLNLGDCFAYAMARRQGVPLLYKGEDFALTDITDGRRA